MFSYNRKLTKSILQTLKLTDKVVVIYGARQVGKTTIAKEILKIYKSTGYFNCEESVVKDVLMSYSSETMFSFFSNHSLIVLDEAQTIPNIGKSIKILVDAYPKLKIIATGSSSFELANKLNEPLTGRKYEYFISGISFDEIKNKLGQMKAVEKTDELLIYGCYPEVLTANSINEKQKILQSLSTSYLYKDVLNYNNIKNPELLRLILKALALQVGSEVSYNEIANMLQIDRKTVISYIDLLEKAFVIFRVQPYFTNGRNELKKKPKIYFYDNGIINVLTNNFSNLTSRNDVGGLWENYLISQRRQFNLDNNKYVNSYFWRTLARQEVDLVEEYDGKLHPYEFKYNSDKISKGSLVFVNSYNTEPIEVINKKNYFFWLS